MDIWTFKLAFQAGFCNGAEKRQQKGSVHFLNFFLYPSFPSGMLGIRPNQFRKHYSFSGWTGPRLEFKACWVFFPFSLTNLQIDSDRMLVFIIKLVYGPRHLTSQIGMTAILNCKISCKEKVVMYCSEVTLMDNDTLKHALHFEP